MGVNSGPFGFLHTNQHIPSSSHTCAKQAILMPHVSLHDFVEEVNRWTGLTANHFVVPKIKEES